MNQTLLQDKLVGIYLQCRYWHLQVYWHVITSTIIPIYLYRMNQTLLQDKLVRMYLQCRYWHLQVYWHVITSTIIPIYLYKLNQTLLQDKLDDFEGRLPNANVRMKKRLQNLFQVQLNNSACHAWWHVTHFFKILLFWQFGPWKWFVSGLIHGRLNVTTIISITLWSRHSTIRLVNKPSITCHSEAQQ